MSDLQKNQLPETSVEEAIVAIQSGKLVIVVDAHERENEGDFICAAELITPETVDFMLKVGRGLLCVPLTSMTVDQLRLPAPVGATENNAPFQTPFLTQVDHKNAGTGVSPENRALTIKELSNPQASHDDFIRPGHIHPLLAKQGGVLRRAGHTEATIDLMQLAGLQPVGVLIEILSPSGLGMADYQELIDIANEHQIPIISIEELIRYRRVREQLVKREVEVTIPTRKYGNPKLIGYSVEHDSQEPLAMVWGDLKNAKRPPLVRMHSSCFTGDLLDSLRCDCGDQLQMAMAMIEEEGTGAVIYLPQEGRGIGLQAKLKAYALQEEGYDTVEANHKLGFKADIRDYMVGLQILKDLGLSKIRLLTNNPKKTDAFVKSAMDLEVVEQVPIIADDHEHRQYYMETKRDKMGHLLPEDES